ncbi:carnitine dehydratase [Gordonia paraffinivorans]|uniref:CaiB/BaiF CoA transferase family protein n=1 Tax=Gordonia paraffinivorans TaxID=175628 RepID=UPI000D6087B1|nr:CoA transferase [Gordonia paraffinivorans]MBY4572532.1 carnitine dehydratase [Gordonia paraffinivorans]PWD41627.1 carnitine dehydratase [Gordonia paraffinivorans]
MTERVADASRLPRHRSGPLAGIRVADFCWMGVGSVATRLLADFGAEVIKIENRKRLDMPRRLPIYKDEVRSYGEEDPNPNPEKGGLFNNYARNKLGITLNMSDPRGRELADRLIRASSVVTENFAPGVMEKWGLTYEHLKSLREDIIYARMSGFGHSGPYRDFRSYGPVIQAVSGLSFNSGLPGREPSGWGLSYMDNQAAYYNSAAILTAIFHRNRTGQGAEIDVSATEVGVNLLGADLLDTLVNNRPSRRGDYPRGNRLEFPQAAPHGVYPSAGDDQWVAIAVFDDEDWRAFVDAIGKPDWALDDRFATQKARFANQDALDAHVGEWTRTRDKYDVMTLLQGAGVACGAVQNPAELDTRDPQIAEYGTFFELDHPVIGSAKFEGVPIDFERGGPGNWRSAPLLGEDNDYVFGTILGLDADERAELAAAGVI